MAKNIEARLALLQQAVLALLPATGTHAKVIKETEEAFPLITEKKRLAFASSVSKKLSKAEKPAKDSKKETKKSEKKVEKKVAKKSKKLEKKLAKKAGKKAKQLSD
jgi:hypothetical protein